MLKKYFGGCDVGSTTGKAVILDEEGNMIAGSIIPSEIDPEITARKALEKACTIAPGVGDTENLAYLIGTGYGRNEVPFANENISEISCHAMGAFWCDPSIKTIVDIGGQDMKAIAVAEDGSVREFAMNDKCAAGTGTFLRGYEPDFPHGARRILETVTQCKKGDPRNGSMQRLCRN